MTRHTSDLLIHTKISVSSTPLIFPRLLAWDYWDYRRLSVHAFIQPFICPAIRLSIKIISDHYLRKHLSQRFHIRIVISPMWPSDLTSILSHSSDFLPNAGLWFVNSFPIIISTTTHHRTVNSHVWRYHFNSPMLYSMGQQEPDIVCKNWLDYANLRHWYIHQPSYHKNWPEFCHREEDNIGENKGTQHAISNVWSNFGSPALGCCLCTRCVYSAKYGKLLWEVPGWEERVSWSISFCYSWCECGRLL